ncbi:hypothetical protein BG015_009377 [Linnemannia schmuckeri]|uniref:Uncharacterized protein n=1 Tax=Linnemannia schmuckeri TaxID=64567 RepID=A0A9P5RW37_9FUNG|nr:hypothetical protein BG015_009377 [Linnemannia schmuckeri]
MNTESENTQPKATAGTADTTTSTSASDLPPIRHTREELMHMHAKELLQILDERHVDHTAVVEKPDLIDLILEKCTH